MTMGLLAPTRVLAHRVNVFAWVEGDMVFVDGFYSSKEKAPHSLVEVFNKAEVKILEGRTNENGIFSFKPPTQTDLWIVLTDGMGHKDDFILYASDLGEMATTAATSPPELHENRIVTKTVTTDLSQLEQMIDKALDRKLAPVIKLIRDARRSGPTFSEIIGGIGYIVGLFGVALYVSTRKKNLGHKAQGD
jgi:nickel transport protein